MFNNLYSGKRVLLTGHTGFKGSYLAFWLRELGAEVFGLALAPEGEINHYRLLELDMPESIADIRDPEAVRRAFAEFKPEIVFHLAAQPLVRASYLDPAGTFAVNVQGTIHVLDACRFAPEVRAVVAVTSDKCYENVEVPRGYREEDPMGGFDPYSASKGCAELAVASYRRSFFHPADYGRKHRLLLASARAGNVIGGGDYAPDRLVPDLIRAAAAGREAEIRNPHSTRPWQHVFEPLSGYLQLGAELYAGNLEAASAWNFGPDDDGAMTVGEAARELAKHWDAIRVRENCPGDAPHEARLLKLDCSKARAMLDWRPVWGAAEAFAATGRWYKDFHTTGAVDTAADFARYTGGARGKNLKWAK